ncbi:patatin-like protein [Aquincola sp. MAHUQ-54]|uniref:Patatin-like protein n=1 Tax=Aquincola agrisoli TaxID=3119538 RepID=A0AAW9Q8S3_9BURK
MAPTGLPGGADYRAEIRFGVVMYGGVSLAIYINGVTNEMYEMACATPRDRRQATAGQPADAGTAPATTREVYRRLSWLVNDPPLLQRYADWLAHPGTQPDPLAAQVPGDLPTRFVIDVIAGTSAGGINGLFLGKALVNDEPFAPLRDLWVREGDIGRLLNDRRSYRDDPDMQGLADRTGEPASLLNSDRMYRKLRKAMDTMSGAGPHGTAPSPYVDELDLYVTTTDIRGSLVTLRLFDKVVHEKRHRQVFRFRYCDDGQQVAGNDLHPGNNAFLSFAARCTSSFPFAFEPMTLEALQRVEPGLGADALRQWDRFFTGVPVAEVQAGGHLTRAFGDGGYLDNKPFTHVVSTLSQRSAAVPLERKLVYIEPAPAHPESAIADPDAPPDALSNALAALTSIPSYETIREDLETVLRRNRRIERIDRIVRLGELDLDNAVDDPMARVVSEVAPYDDDGIPPWRELTMERMRLYYGDAFLPYNRLRQYTVTDEITDRLAREWKIERNSDHVYALRALVRAWREERYSDKPNTSGRWIGTLNAFLDDFDLAYRVRRTAFLLRKVDQLTRLIGRRLRGPLADPSEADAALVGRLKRAGIDLQDDAADPERHDMLAALHRLKIDLSLAHGTLRHRDPLNGAADRGARAQRRAVLRRELQDVLDLLLLSRPQGADGEAPTLSTASGETVHVAFPPELLKLPSATRTLQEGIFLRARALLALARGTALTSLQQALEEDIDLLGAAVRRLVKGEGSGPPIGGALVWARLGGPRLAVTDNGTGGKQLYVQVGDAGEPELDTPAARQLRRFLGEYYLRFDTYDQMSYPLYYDTESGEPATVEVVRISPEDAPALVDERADGLRKLDGTALANFGAFLQRHWRSNDIMWGRLDGAERLVAALLPGPDAATRLVRDTLTRQAHRCIVRDALRPAGYEQITGLLCGAVAEVQARSKGVAGDDPDARREALRKQLVARLTHDSPESRRRFDQVVSSLLDDDALLAWVKASREGRQPPDPGPMLDSAARAVTITGRLLQTLVSQRGQDMPALRWVARLGLAGQGLLAVSLPGSLRARWWSHVMKVLYAFLLVMLAAGLAFGSEPVRTAAITGMGVVGALHLAILLAGDVLHSRRSWRAKSAWALGIPLVLLAALGVLALARMGWRDLLGL